MKILVPCQTIPANKICKDLQFLHTTSRLQVLDTYYEKF